MEKKRPVYEKRLGRIRVAVWLNQNDGGDAWHTITVTRSYRKDGEWNDSTSFARDDVPVVVMAFLKAYWWLWEHRAAPVEEEGVEVEPEL